MGFEVCLDAQAVRYPRTEILVRLQVTMQHGVAKNGEVDMRGVVEIVG